MKRLFSKKSLLLIPLLTVVLIFSSFPVLGAEEVPGTVPDVIEKEDELDPFQVMAASPNALQPVATETGYINLSLDAAGSNGASHIVQVEKPAGATVRKAYLVSATIWNTGQISNGDIEINGTGVNWDLLVPNSIASWNHWADVTSIVKPTIDAAPAGRVDFTLTEVSTGNIDGEILAVIFDDPNQTEINTIILLFGAQDIAGDTFNIGLANPLDLTDPNLVLDFSLGITYSYQIGDNQYSQVDVNGQRISTSAGGEDDGFSGNGGLITVGGLDDNNTNPPDPYSLPGYNPRYDDELYNLIPYVSNGDTSIQVYTQNPSYDDNICFAALFLGSTIAIVGEGIVLSPGSAINQLGTPHTVTATVQDDQGQPVVGRDVTFDIVSGPHAGNTYTEPTDSNGQASYTYTGSSLGTDVIEATFLDSTGAPLTSNQVTKEWVGDEPPVMEVGGDVSPVNKAGLLIPWIALAVVTVIILGATMVIRRRRIQS